MTTTFNFADIKKSIEESGGGTQYFDTIALLQLQTQNFDKFGFSPSLIETCQTCRKEYMGIQVVATYNADEDCYAKSLDIFRKLWEAFSFLNEAHILYIPPIYESNAINKFLIDVIKGIRLREVSDRVFEMGHPVLGGVEGTGKTTLVKALAIGVAICSEKYFLAYIHIGIYTDKTLVTPHWVVAEITARLSMCKEGNNQLNESQPTDLVQGLVKDSSIPQLLQACLKMFGLKIGIIVDEVQMLFQPNASAADASVIAVNQYQVFARQCKNTMVILTGSSSKLRMYLYKSQYDVVDYKNYPDFNKSLTTCYSVSALRKLDELKVCIYRRYPDVTFDEEKEMNSFVSNLFYNTGGVGRFIHEFMSGNKQSGIKLLSDVEHCNEFLVFLNILRQYQFQSKVLEDIISKVDTQLVLEHISTDMISIPISVAIASMGSHGIQRAASYFVKWTDTGYLYQDDESIHLVRPKDAEVYYQENISPP